MVPARPLADGGREVCPRRQSPERVHPPEARRADHPAAGCQALRGAFALGEEDRPPPPFSSGTFQTTSQPVSPLSVPLL